VAVAASATVPEQQCVSLSQAGVGKRLMIRSLEGPGCQRLRELGFCESMAVVKLANGRNMVCALCGTRMALSRDLGDQVMVSALA
jgi:Fe2+ transport system protein FeoA